MIYQDDPRFTRTPINRWGCFYLSAMWYIALLTKTPFSAELLEDVLLDLQLPGNERNGKPIVRADCYVNNYDALADYMGVRVLGPARWADETELVLPEHQQLLVYTNGRFIHATAGQHHDVVTYDPKRALHKRPEWYLESRRVLTWRWG